MKLKNMVCYEIYDNCNSPFSFMVGQKYWMTDGHFDYYRFSCHEAVDHIKLPIDEVSCGVNVR